MAGKLYGIGVGPGDPELLTIKAVELLKRCDHIFTPIAKEGGASVAFDIARRFIPATTPVTRLLFPMLKDRQVLEQQWSENYRAMEAVVRAGRACAFITLGDSGPTAPSAWLCAILSALPLTLRSRLCPASRRMPTQQPARVCRLWKAMK